MMLPSFRLLHFWQTQKDSPDRFPTVCNCPYAVLDNKIFNIPDCLQTVGKDCSIICGIVYSVFKFLSKISVCPAYTYR